MIATPLHWAARAGHVQMVTLLYKKGADITLMDAQGYNALHLAVHAGHSMMIVYLISIGLEVDSRDSMVCDVKVSDPLLTLCRVVRL